jgi:hypothetical protein
VSFTLTYGVEHKLPAFVANLSNAGFINFVAAYAFRARGRCFLKKPFYLDTESQQIFGRALNKVEIRCEALSGCFN